MEMKRKVKMTTLQSYIVKFVVRIVVIVLIAILATLIFFTVGFSSGILRNANYAEKLVQKAENNIKKASTVTVEMIPEELHYAVLNKDNLDIVSGNMSQSEIKKAIAAINKNENDGLSNDIYTVIERENEYCVIHYRLAIQFADPLLRKYVPMPAIAYTIATILFLGGALYFNIHRFSKSLKQELERLNDVTEKIVEEDLSFSLHPTRFIEFDHVLHSLNSLRSALQRSIHAQVVQEKNKQEQMTALVHDIKIPITIIRGNAELLSISPLTEDQTEYTEEIVDASQQIEKYVKYFIHVLHHHSDYKMNKSTIEIANFLSIIEKETRAFLAQSSVRFNLENKIASGVVWEIDNESMSRAFMNVIMNARQYSMETGTIMLIAHEDGENIIFNIIDEGTGFTEEALHKGKEMFYTADSSRSTTEHYGIGLAFASKVAQAHHGELLLENKCDGTGGCVIFKFPRDRILKPDVIL
jgi:signal transduction histidine kinase